MAIIVATKKDLAEKVAESADLTKNKAAEAVNAVFEAISETLKDGGEVSVSGFGKFEVSERAARQGVNPATPKFKPAKALKEAVK